MGETAAVMCFICCFLFAPFVVHSVGFFTPNWGSNSTCDAIGLIYSCCTNSNETGSCGNTDGGDELDVRVLGLQATSLCIMLLTVVGLCCGVCLNKDDDDNFGYCMAIGSCCMVLFPVAGLFNIIGCIIVATKFATSELGYSFILSLTSGCFIVLVTIIIICVVCKLVRDEDEDMPDSPETHRRVAHTQASADVYPYNVDREIGQSYSREEIVAQQTTMQQAVAVHDEESGRLMVFIRRINITRLAHQFSHVIE